MVTATPPLLTPDRARCRVLSVAVRAPSWRWDDLADDTSPRWPAQPMLPFDGETPEVSAPAGDVPPEVRRMAMGLTQAMTEVLSGLRPAVQLEGWLDDSPLRVLAEAAKLYRRRGPSVASIRLQLTARGSVEVAVRLRRGQGSSAVAYRLDRRRSRWRCTALVVGP